MIIILFNSHAEISIIITENNMYYNRRHEPTAVVVHDRIYSLLIMSTFIKINYYLPLLLSGII